MRDPLLVMVQDLLEGRLDHADLPPPFVGYFPFVIRAGVRLLFFCLVFAIGAQLASQWNSALATVCKPVTIPVPLIS
jgi:hypothetical protein